MGIWVQPGVFAPRWSASVYPLLLLQTHFFDFDSDDLYPPTNTSGGTRVRLDFGKRELVIAFVDQCLLFEATVRFSGIRQMAHKRESVGLIHRFYVDLKWPPALQFISDVAGPSWPTGQRVTGLPSSGPGDHTEDLLGGCLVYLLDIGSEVSRPFSTILARLKRKQFYTADVCQYVQGSEQSAHLVSNPQSFEGIDDRLCYALSCLLSAGYVRLENITHDFVVRLQRLECKADIDQAKRALYRMYGKHKRFYNPGTSFHRAWHHAGEAEAEEGASLWQALLQPTNRPSLRLGPAVVNPQSAFCRHPSQPLVDRQRCSHSNSSAVLSSICCAVQSSLAPLGGYQAIGFLLPACLLC